MKTDYNEILNPLRLQKTSIPDRKPIDEFLSDRSRILYSSSFRRLQQKAQVFSLEPNSSVRTRLTHSLEVADVGRNLARNICIQLKKNKILSSNSGYPELIVAIVENACLLHDIGNPPFGHFGEAAIKKWVSDNLRKYANSSGILPNISKNRDTSDKEIANNKFKIISEDFKEFDGNPQGLRVMMHLHCERDKYGLNLTYPTILSYLKYPKMAGELNKAWKKSGYFLTESVEVQQIYESLNMSSGARYPLSYIMETADDISYSLSDISDGIEKRIITMKDFLDEFRREWGDSKLPQGIDVNISSFEYFSQLSIAWSRTLIEVASNTYIANHQKIWDGTAKGLLDGTEYAKVLDTIKAVSRTKLYRSYEAESIELSGYSIISGLLKHFGELLKLKRKQFELFTSEIDSPAGKGLDLQWRIFNRLSPRVVKCYKLALDEATSFPERYSGSLDLDDIEWWLRVHMVIDHISGMTDRFALETYQMFEGMI